MPQRRKKKKTLWIGGLLGFLIGIAGNLVAAWIQQDVLNNSFTPLRIVLVILCSLIGIFIMTALESKSDQQAIKEKSDNQKNKNFYSRIKIAWSKLKTRGKGIHIEDVSAIGSDIDIDTE